MPNTTLPRVANLVRDGTPVPGIAPADFKGAVCCVQRLGIVVRALPRRGADFDDACAGHPHPHGLIIIRISPTTPPLFGRYGNPFAAVGADISGRTAIDWGVYGVPETFVVGRERRIAYKLIGPITPENISTILKPQLEKALAAP